MQIVLNDILEQIRSPNNKRIISKANNSGCWHWLEGVPAECYRAGGNFQLMIYDAYLQAKASQVYEFYYNSTGLYVSYHARSDNNDHIYSEINRKYHSEHLPIREYTEEKLFQDSMIYDIGQLNLVTFTKVKDIVKRLC